MAQRLYPNITLPNRIELNILLNSFYIGRLFSLARHNLVNGIIDPFGDESGVDTGASTYEDYDSTDDYYSPLTTAETELDYMEYATDGAAQAAYVSSDTAAEVLVIEQANSNTYLVIGDTGGVERRAAQSFVVPAGGWTITAISAYMDTRVGTPTGDITWRIETDTAGLPSGALAHANLTKALAVTDNAWNKATFASSAWIDAGTYWIVTVLANQDADEYYKLAFNGPDDYPDGGAARNWDEAGWILYGGSSDCKFRVYALIDNLQSYSEDTIKTQGSYSLKGVAVQTDSLNDTLTKAGLSIDLTDIDTLKIDVYASRTGTNLRLKIHDSGGTTSTKDIVISVAGAWETTTWDISGIANVDKDDIDSIIIEIINADAANTFYLDDFHAPGITNNMTLISAAITAAAQPDIIDTVVYGEDVDAVTINTDIKLWGTRDGGTTWEQGTLVDKGFYTGTKWQYNASINVSGQPAGVDILWKVTTHNAKNLKLYGVGLVYN